MKFLEEQQDEFDFKFKTYKFQGGYFPCFHEPLSLQGERMLYGSLTLKADAKVAPATRQYTLCSLDHFPMFLHWYFWQLCYMNPIFSTHLLLVFPASDSWNCIEARTFLNSDASCIRLDVSQLLSSNYQEPLSLLSCFRHHHRGRKI